MGQKGRPVAQKWAHKPSAADQPEKTYGAS
jgi:hypothetical protein